MGKLLSLHSVLALKPLRLKRMISMLRFCYECKYRRIVDELPIGELRCRLHPEIKIFNSTEATQCIADGDFDEICI